MFYDYAESLKADAAALQSAVHAEQKDSAIKTFDVVHKRGAVECIDPWGEMLASFRVEDVLAYSLNPRVAEKFSTSDDADTTAPRRTGDRP